jgi:ATP-binding cassette, subfamily B, multidrug efflux pump
VIFQTIAAVMYSMAMSVVSGKSVNRLRKSLFDKLQRLSLRFFDQSNDGDILSRFTNDLDNISNAICELVSL